MNIDTFAKDARLARGGNYFEGDCPVCFHGSASRCTSKSHARVLSVIDPQPEPYLEGREQFLRLGAETPRSVHKLVVSAGLTCGIERSIGGMHFSGWPETRKHSRYVAQEQGRMLGAAVVCDGRWLQVAFAWVHPDHRESLAATFIEYLRRQYREHLEAEERERTTGRFLSHEFDKELCALMKFTTQGGAS